MVEFKLKPANTPIGFLDQLISIHFPTGKLCAVQAISQAQGVLPTDPSNTSFFEPYAFYGFVTNDGNFIGEVINLSTPPTSFQLNKTVGAAQLPLAQPASAKMLQNLLAWSTTGYDTLIEGPPSTPGNPQQININRAQGAMILNFFLAGEQKALVSKAGTVTAVFATNPHPVRTINTSPQYNLYYAYIPAGSDGFVADIVWYVHENYPPGDPSQVIWGAYFGGASPDDPLNFLPPPDAVDIRGNNGMGGGPSTALAMLSVGGICPQNPSGNVLGANPPMGLYSSYFGGDAAAIAGAQSVCNYLNSYSITKPWRVSPPLSVDALTGNVVGNGQSTLSANNLPPPQTGQPANSWITNNGLLVPPLPAASPNLTTQAPTATGAYILVTYTKKSGSIKVTQQANKP